MSSFFSSKFCNSARTSVEVSSKAKTHCKQARRREHTTLALAWTRSGNEGINVKKKLRLQCYTHILLSCCFAIEAVKINKILHRNHQSSWFIGRTPYSVRRKSIASSRGNVNEFYSKISGIFHQGCLLPFSSHIQSDNFSLSEFSSMPFTTQYLRCCRRLKLLAWKRRLEKNRLRKNNSFHDSFSRSFFSQHNQAAALEAA